MARAACLRLLGLFCAVRSLSAEPSHHHHHSDKIERLQKDAEASVAKAEMFANELTQILNIDKIADKPFMEAKNLTQKEKNAVDAELTKLQHLIGKPNSTTDADAAAAIEHARNSIETLLDDQSRVLEKETRRETDEAIEAVRGAQDVARRIARDARADSDHYARSAHNSRAAADHADLLARRAEDAATKSERNGETLTRRIEDVLQENLNKAEDMARHRAHSQEHHIPSMVHVHANAPSFLGARDVKTNFGTHAMFAFVGAFSLGSALVYCIATRGMIRKSSIEMPAELLG